MEDGDEDIIKVMQSVLTDSLSSKKPGFNGPSVTPHEITISAWANSLYLDALLNTKRFEDYIGVSINLMMVNPLI